MNNNKTYLIIDKDLLEKEYQHYHNLWNKAKNQVEEWRGVGGTEVLEAIQENSTEITLPNDKEIEKMAEEYSENTSDMSGDGITTYEKVEVKIAYKTAFKACLELLKQKK